MPIHHDALTAVEDNRWLIKIGLLGAVGMLLTKTPSLLRAAMMHCPPPAWTYGVLIGVLVRPNPKP